MNEIRFLILNLILIIALSFTGCSEKASDTNESGNDNQSEGAIEADETLSDRASIGADEIDGAELINDESNSMPRFISHVELDYAHEFSIDLYEDGYASIHITDGNSYVLVPEGCDEKILDDENAVFINKPCDSIYLAASSAMDLFKELDGIDKISSCSTKAEDYVDSEVSDAINTDKIHYVGKYSAPDYEKLISLNTGLALESTMIYHAPKIKEELEGLNIPVLVERASYETEPLGRLEWIKLYGLILNKSDEADSIFNAQVDSVNEVINKLAAELSSTDEAKPKVLFFYLSSNGYVNVRKPGDYVSKMIETAGGMYALDSVKPEEENALSTMNISWEDFYLYGKDADIIIYNGTIDGGITSVDELVKQNEMFKEFKAVKDDRVYCSNNNMYQEISKTGDIITELYDVINNKEAELTYIRKVK